ncbi:MAG: zinc-ribbon domain-containing protein, partial [Dehalococcoidia bacterium]|nr:zinc-ribbon domain-containing protein [Dehalococcoidia bacterium]
SVDQVRTKFTIFFVPTFSFSQKQFLVCTTCQVSFEVTNELKPEIAKSLMSQEELSAFIGQINREAEEERKKLLAAEGLSLVPGEYKKVDKENSTNYCTQCGQRLSQGMSYCPECGAKAGT